MKTYSHALIPAGKAWSATAADFEATNVEPDALDALSLSESHSFYILVTDNSNGQAVGVLRFINDYGQAWVLATMVVKPGSSNIVPLAIWQGVCLAARENEVGHLYSILGPDSMESLAIVGASPFNADNECNLHTYRGRLDLDRPLLADALFDGDGLENVLFAPDSWDLA